MKSELVIGIDCSTTATKAIAWDYEGNNIAEVSSTIPLSSPHTNYYEQNPDDWWHSTVDSLKRLFLQIDAERVVALAISNQRETFVGLDKYGRPLRPAIIWLDERCKNQVEKFAAEIGEDRIHRITGKPKDFAPVVYRLAWMKENEEALYRNVAKFCDVHTYLVYRLTSQFKTSWASADPLGIFDLENKRWSEEILNKLQISLSQLPEAYSPGTVLGRISKSASNSTGLKAGTMVIAGGGDGQAAGLGVNALLPQRAYLNLGTAVVSGIYTKEYITDVSFRTMISCSEEGFYCETSLRSGTFLIDWFLKQILMIDAVQIPDIYQTLENEANKILPGCEELMVLPYWNAVMNPYWDPDARGCIIGLSPGHNRGHLYRAMLEGIAMEQEIAIIGGGAKSKLWRQIVADTSGKRVLTMSTDEASSLGAGISAAIAAGWFKSFEEAANHMVHVKSITNPLNKNIERYREQLNTYSKIYPAFKGIYKKNKSIDSIINKI